MPVSLNPLFAASGRIILGLYFLIFGGIYKLLAYEATAAYMADHGMIMVPFFLILTMLIQLAGGISLIVGYKTQFFGFLLAGLTLVISVVMHNFWAMEPGTLQTGHETQNFVKNMGIIGGLLTIAGLGAGTWSLDHKLANKQ